MLPVDEWGVLDKLSFRSRLRPRGVAWFLEFHNPAEFGFVSAEAGLLSRVWRVERCGGETLITDGVEAELGRLVAHVSEPELTGFLTDAHSLTFFDAPEHDTPRHRETGILVDLVG